MSVPDHKTTSIMRRKAEELFESNPAKTVIPASEIEVLKLVQELEVHQIELEMQNEELLRSHAAARFANDRYVELYDFAPVGYFTLSHGGRIIELNLLGAKMLGKERSFLKNSNFASFISESKKTLFNEFYDKLFVSQVKENCEIEIVSGSSIIPVLLTGIIAENREQCLITMTDISEFKKQEAENLKLQELFNQAQKMESVGRLAGGVAHDFNNMLSVILGQTQLALMDIEDKNPYKHTFEQISLAAMRSADLTRQLLAFARKQVCAPKIIDFNSTIESMLKLLRRLIGEDVDLKWLPENSNLQVKIDPTQVDQILTNLLVNARDVLDGEGEITVSTGFTCLTAVDCINQPDMVAGEFVSLVVSDNGSGMTKDVIEHIFDPFFTTKEVGKGTGLGLASVYGIVKQNKGHIHVSSEPGKGTTFTIYLPCCQLLNQDNEQINRETIKIPGGPETILVVEDEPDVLEISKSMLQSLGYTILTALTPEEGIDTYKQNEGKIQLVLTDVILPHINGRELAKHLQNLSPSLKILFMSGYTADYIDNHGFLDENIFFLPKPFTSKELGYKVRDVLDS